MSLDLTSFAGKKLRALGTSRIWLSPLAARLSPRRATMAGARRLEEEGRFDEAMGVWQKLEGSRHFRAARFRIMLTRARAAQHIRDWPEAVKLFDAVLAMDPHDMRAKRGLEVSALHAARDAQADGRWLEACRMWAAYGRSGADKRKCVRNLCDCARFVAQSADDAEKMAEALEGWTLLGEADPKSVEAQQGIQWSHLSIARFAERKSDTVTARKHLEALLEVSPGDQRALDGLKRLSGA